jgi:murein L,D-transpeptidase YafK
MFRRLISIALSAALVFAALFVISAGGWHRAVDRAWLATRHLNQRLYYGLGYQLPGTPDLNRLDARLAAKGLKRGDPVFLRIFKSEMRLEVWMKRGARFLLFESYPICYWSGRLGPKLKTGDRQAPEGFYTVAKAQLNPNSQWHRSFNLGFPNLYDRAHGRTGSFLMVHGGCASIGCYAMTNGVVAEIWDLITAALDSGQLRFGVHVIPFRLTQGRLNAYAGEPWAAFWQELRPGFELFEQTHVPPEISLCEGKYAVRPGRPEDASPSALRQFCPPPQAPAQS